MAIILNPEIPPLVFGVNQPVKVQLGVTSASSPAVTSWAALGLPTGLVISNSGKITGHTAEDGVHQVQVWGNASGNSGNITFNIGIDPRISSLVPGGAVEVDIDIRSGAVSIPGNTPGNTGAIGHAKRGDTIQFAVGIAKDKVLQELDLVALTVGVKRFETEPAIATSDGVFYRVGGADATRWITDLTLPATALDPSLSDVERERGTAADYLVEIQAVWNYWPPGTDPEDEDAEPRVQRRTCQTFKLRIERDWLS
jgi:hypothetical protein